MFLRYSVIIMNIIEKYKQEVLYLESLGQIDKQKNLMNDQKNPENYLKRAKFLLKLLGNPQRKIKNYIHIGGTSGKGSVSNMVHNIIVASGKKSGLFTQPFLTETIEKYKINDRLISPKSFVKILNKIKPAINKCTTDCKWGLPSYFEICFAIYILYSLEQKCEFFVSEVAMGGEFDMTNAIPRSKITAITHVDYDHTEQLGHTLNKIATTKSKIIKKKGIFITAETRPNILKIFKNECQKQHTQFYKVNVCVNNLQVKKNYQQFEYKKKKYRLKMFGEHQAKNAILAIEIAKRLKVKGEYIKHGLFNTKIPGRFEIVQTRPLVVLDGAHNPDKIRTVVESLGLLNYNKLHLICAFCACKDINKAVKILSQYADHVYITRFFVKERIYADPRKIKRYFQKYNPKLPIDINLDPWQTLDIVLKQSKRNDLVLITGSFFLVGELRKKWFSVAKILRSRKVF